MRDLLLKIYGRCDSTLRSVTHLDGSLATDQHAGRTATIEIDGFSTSKVSKNLSDLSCSEAIYTLCHLTSFAYEEDKSAIFHSADCSSWLVSVRTYSTGTVEEFLDISIHNLTPVDKNRTATDRIHCCKVFCLLRINRRR